MSFNDFQQKKSPVEVVVIWAVVFVPVHWFGKLLSTAASSVVVPVQTCAGLCSKSEKEGKKGKTP